VLGVARACAEHITAAPFGHAGLAHGASGLAVALLRVAELSAPSEAARFRARAADAFAHEATLYDATEGTWRDLRPGAEALRLTAFCHGAAGIGLARVEASRMSGTALGPEAHAAIAYTRAHGFGVSHSLCHGDFGNLELLLLANEDYGDRLARVCASLDAEGPITGVPKGIETPGLFTGLAGIGWQLLRFASPEHVPSVLTFAAPPASTHRRGPADPRGRTSAP
jgi:lantibiotic modifying enzyme